MAGLGRGRLTLIICSQQDEQAYAMNSNMEDVEMRDAEDDEDDEDAVASELGRFR